MNINGEHVWLKSDDEIAVLNAINWLYRIGPKADSYTAVEIIKVAGPGGGRRPALKALTERGILKLKDGARYAFPEARTPSSDYCLKKILFNVMLKRGYIPGHGELIIWNRKGVFCFMSGVSHAVNFELPKFPFGAEHVVLSRKEFYRCMQAEATSQLERHAEAERGE
jgi:hypothetical protein